MRRVIEQVVVVVSSSHQSPSLCVSRFRSAQSIAILLSCGRLPRAIKKVVGVMRRMTAVVAMVARCLVYSIHVQTKDSSVTCAQLCQYSSCLPLQCLLAVAMGGGRPLGSFDELLLMTVLTTSWWMLLIADL